MLTLVALLIFALTGAHWALVVACVLFGVEVVAVVLGFIISALS